MEKNLKQRRKSQSTAKSEGKAVERALAGKVLTGGEVLENAGSKWLVRVGPPKIVPVAQDAPLCEMAVGNGGPAAVVVRMEDGLRTILAPGDSSILSTYGAIAIESPWNKFALVQIEFRPPTEEIKA